MQKIIELTTKDFMTGLAVSSHMPSSGIFHEASGINPYRDAFTSTDNVGLLQTGEGPSAVEGSVVVDTIRGATYLGSSYLAYLIGSSGHLYEFSTGTFSTPTDKRSGGAISNAAEGITIYQINGGAKYLYYWQQSQIGRWDLTTAYPTNWIDNYIGSGGTINVTLQSTLIRPIHHFLGNVYFGNKEYVGAIKDLGTGSFSSSNVSVQDLDVPSDFTVVTLSDDGYHLVIGTTTNAIAGNISVHTRNKILFWDTVSSSWQREWDIPTAYIASIQKMGNFLYAICADGLYAFNFTTPPTLLVPLSSNDAPSCVGGVTPSHQTACVKDGVLYWLSVGADVCAYGSPLPGLTPRFYKPFKAQQGGVPSHLSVAGKFRLVTADENNFGTINLQNGGDTELTAETIYIPLERKWNIQRIEVVLGETMASGDELDIRLQSDEDTAATTWGTVSYTLDGAVRTKTLPGEYIAENLKMFFDFLNGNVKIKKIMVFGEPMFI